MKQLAAWYQKKISSYDKEEWETMVEQLLMRSTYRRRVVDFSSQSRPYLIDVDLVRGSSFPKAKPTLSMRRVIWYALVRLVFYPALYEWWKQQTAPICARVLLALWTMQVANIALYFCAPSNVVLDAYCWLVPLGLMLVLNIVHAQIVSTTEMELARVRPRSAFHRKLPQHCKRETCQGDNSGICSNDSAASSPQGKKPRTKSTKYRRKPSADGDSGLRKRKNDPKQSKELSKHKTSRKDKQIRTKAKDSDDEDYMPWKNPTLTFTPPSDDAIHTPNVLTKKRLDTFNMRQQNIARNVLADGDDGFESLNGNISNGSEERKDKAPVEINKENDLNSTDNTNEGNGHSATNKDDIDLVFPITVNDSTEIKEAKTISNNAKVKLNNVVTSDNKCVRETVNVTKETNDSDHLEASSPSEGKRVGVRFHSGWSPGDDDPDSSERYSDRPKKIKKQLDNYQSSTSDGDCSASAPSIALPSHLTMSDWVGQTTNSEESSCYSQSDAEHTEVGFRYTGDSTWDPFALLNPTSDTVKCTMWESGDMLRAELSAVDISWYVVARAERAMAADGGFLWAGLAMALATSLLGPLVRVVQLAIEQDSRTEDELQLLSLPSYIISLVISYGQTSYFDLFYGAFGDNIWEIATNTLSCCLRFSLSALVFFLLAVAERAYKQRFLYAKLFSHLTSTRRARKSELPHFRLNTVRNIKTWLSTRSYLRRRGPQRSVDVIVSAAFMLTIILLACVSAHLLREGTIDCGWLLDAMVWSLCLGIYLLRLLTLGSNVNKKYRGCLSTILTEQINLHLAIEQRPESKERLTVANNVLKLAADLLKELDSPFKISGICANHYLYTITKVVILSALSGVLSEMLGFKLKLHKIKIK